MRRAAVLVLGIAALAFPANAAAVKTHRCADEPGARCGTLNVKVDREGKVKGTVPLRFAYRGRLKGKAPMLALSGGPGQAGVLLLADFADSLAPALRGRGIVVVDQRGTGRSGLLRCRALEKADLLHAGKEAAQCARKLGARRDYYTSEDTIADLEALRKALGIKQWSIYGVSYGTKVAALYAARFPAVISRLVLDSVVEPEGPDPLYGPTFEAIPRVLREICSGRLCRGVTTDMVADMGKLVARLDKGAMRGYVVGRTGKRKKASLGRNRLFATMLAGDFDESLRAELPTAVRSALRGDPAPALRLARRAALIEGGGSEPQFLSPTLYSATVCTEQIFPWQWEATSAIRLSQARQAVEALQPASFFPFDFDTVLDSDEIDLCSRWPANRRGRPAPVGALPDIPALLVNGRDDLRTPLEGAQRLGAGLKSSTLVTIPGVGHSVFGSDLTGCSERALRNFFAGKKVSTTCRRRHGRIRPDGPIPRSLSEVTGRGKREKTVNAVDATMFDVLEQSADSLLIDPFGFIRGGGLRSGRYFETRNSIALRAVEFVPGVKISGELFEGGAADVRVTGRAAANGRLRFGKGRVTGVLDGRRVSARASAAGRKSASALVSRHLTR